VRLGITVAGLEVEAYLRAYCPRNKLRTEAFDCDRREGKQLLSTRSQTPYSSLSCKELTSIALSLGEHAGLNPGQRFRLVGVGLINFRDPED
jgi:hypothetical protein